MAISTARRSSNSREGGKVAPLGRSASGWRRASPWLAAGILLAVAAASNGTGHLPRFDAVPSVGYAHPATNSETLYLNLTDKPAFKPRAIGAAPGMKVSILLHNSGTLEHSFTLSNQSGKLVPSSDDPAQLYAYFAAHPPIVNVSAAPGTNDTWANFTVAGNASFDSFEFVSVVPYQFQAGMWGYLNISSSLPPVALSDNTTNSFSFQPSSLSISPAQYPVNVQVTVTNLGTYQHTFTLSGQPNVTLTTIGYFHTNPPLANISIPDVVGHSAMASFAIKLPGIYEYVCTIPGHFTEGMFGFLYVGVPVPAPPAPPSTAIFDTWLLAGSLALLGIGVLLVAVAGFTGRFPQAPPPSHGDH